MFTRQQLDLLLVAQSGDDWTDNYFRYHRVFEVRDDIDISQEDFEVLVVFLDGLNYEQTRHLQLALMLLDELPKG